MKFFLTTAAVLAAASPALALSGHSNSTVAVPACPPTSSSTMDVVTRSPVPVMTPSAPVPSFYTVPTNETAGGSGWPGASSGATWSATATPPVTSPSSPAYTGAAVVNHPVAFGGVVVAAAAGVMGWVL
ncbi:uncharacterized protein K452DRAFT_300962 [Aplosporella prunicola CBS 121167]|uniref:Uncharacterized protein n=1 Tax=Aplosporella prunicola CBS 121167 TaxID=1176127 RepID=A0A6A6B2Y5_9PEZI|nr:uncharacterized protein K452DRAFT_300962 [Aplosporella prunicola CBS 121167]KAF2138410.1 hypothetical protein K452DRAFT_300962 [Aplosporella prunicola CBS 121167]